MASNPIHPEFSMDWPKRAGAMSEEEFHKLERLNPDAKYEYIDGVAYMMSGGTVGHDRIAYNARSLLDLQFRSGPCTAFGADVQVCVGIKKNGKKQYVYPDATVSCDVTDKRIDNTLIESPRVIVEVLSPGTEARDRGIKFKAYQKCPTIQEIVLVNQFAQYIEVWQRDQQNVEQWNYRHYGPGETVEFASLDVHFEINELYRGLTFATGEDEDDE